MTVSLSAYVYSMPYFWRVKGIGNPHRAAFEGRPCWDRNGEPGVHDRLILN